MAVILAPCTNWGAETTKIEANCDTKQESRKTRLIDCILFTELLYFLPTGKRFDCYGQSPLVMGKLTNFLWPCSIANRKKLPEGIFFLCSYIVSFSRSLLEISFPPQTTFSNTPSPGGDHGDHGRLPKSTTLRQLRQMTLVVTCSQELWNMGRSPGHFSTWV